MLRTWRPTPAGFTLSANGDLEIKDASAAGAMAINAGSVALNGTVSNGGALTLQANQLSSSANSVVLSAGDIRITAVNATLAGTLLGDQQLLIDSATLAHSGASQAGDIRIQGGTLVNRGTLSAEGNFTAIGSNARQRRRLHPGPGR